MKIFLLSIIIALGIIACGESNKTPSRQTSKAVKVAGSRLYIQNCKQCHGTKGDLGLNGAAKFSESKLTLQERIDVITNGRKPMLPYKGILKKSEIKAVAEYTLKLK